LGRAGPVELHDRPRFAKRRRRAGLNADLRFTRALSEDAVGARARHGVAQRDRLREAVVVDRGVPRPACRTVRLTAAHEIVHDLGHLTVDLDRGVGARNEDRPREAAGGRRRAGGRILIDRENGTGAGLLADRGELIDARVEELLVDLQIVGASAGEAGQHRQRGCAAPERRDGTEFTRLHHYPPPEFTLTIGHRDGAKNRLPNGWLGVEGSICVRRDMSLL
jgi:hypothetical protein